MVFQINEENEVFNLSKKVADSINSSMVIYLNGHLGTGKTTFAKGLIKSLGFTNIVNSPTFSIIKAYDNIKIPIYHFDLYRIENFQEMESIGMKEKCKKKSIVLIEWIEKANRSAPKSDLVFYFLQKKNYRKIFLYANTRKGKKFIFKFK